MIGSPTEGLTDEAVAALGHEVMWLSPDSPLRWSDLGIHPPEIFIHTGWAHRGFNNLAKETRAAGGRVVAMIDNSRKHTIRQFVGALVFRLAYRRRMDFAWVPGQSGADLMRYLGMRNRSISMGLYGADPTVFHRGKPICERPNQFLFVGQLVERKRPDLLLKAFKRFQREFDDWSLLFIGSGPMLAPLNAAGAQIIPFSSASVVAQYMRESRFLVLPSRDENWGVVVHEAALAGCGLILSEAVGSHKDLLEENGYLFETDDEEALLHSLRRAASLSESQSNHIYKESLRISAEFGPSRFLAAINDFSGRVNL